MDIFVRALNGTLMIVLPLALGMWVARRFRVDWRWYGFGAATFILSQVFHIPFNQWVLLPFLERLGWSGSAHGWEYGAFALAVGLSAGVFEETARYLTYRFGLNNFRSWRNGLMLGAGHGGIEAVLFGALALYGFAQALALRGADLSTVVSPEQLPLAEAQLAAYWAAPWHLAILGAVERLGALGVHLGLSILVLQVFARKQARWLGLAIAWHTLVNALALLIVPGGGPYWTEVFVILAGGISLWMAYRLRTPEPELAPSPTQPVVPMERLSLDDLKTDQIEDSRYV